jgi:hypothetical protein
MDDLTESQRRQIYEEEKQKEGERRRRRGRRPDLLWLAVIAFLVLFVAAIPIVGQAGLVERALAGNEAQVREAGKYPTAPPDALPTPAPTPAGLVERALAGNEAQVREAGKYPTAPPDALPTPAPTPAAGMRTTFGDGVWLIGYQIPPGTYRTEPPSAGCYWARVAESSDLTRLNARSTAATDAGAWSAGIKSPTEVVWIQDTDAAFETVGCGIWRRLAE